MTIDYCYNPEPRWVTVDNVLHHVSDFAHLIPRQRPSAFCPLCSNQAILKLGKKRVHHYSHKAGTNCPISNRETVLHMNTKFHLYRELMRGRELRVARYCQGKCGTKIELIWASDWTDVKVEYKIDAVRPDIVLLRDGTEIGAIEVFAKHAVDPLKTQYLAQKELPWLEVRATQELYDGEKAWRIEKSLPFYTINPDEEILCDKCLVLRSELRPDPEKEMSFVAPDDYMVGRRGDVLNQRCFCQLCGNETDDWWMFDGKTNTCKCRSCLKRGIY